MSLNNGPEAIMWMMLIKLHGRRVTISWPSLCITQEDAKTEAEGIFDCEVIALKGYECLYYNKKDNE